MSAESVLRMVLQVILQGEGGLDTLTEDLQGASDAAGQVTEAAGEMSEGVAGATEQADGWAEALAGVGDAAADAGEEVDSLGDDMDGAADSGSDFGGGLDKLMELSGGFGKITKIAGAEVRMLGEAFDFAEQEADRLGRSDVADKIRQMKVDVGDFKDALLQLPIPLISFPGVEARSFLDWMGDAAQGLSNIVDLAGAVGVQFQLATGQITQEQAIQAINDLTGETERLAAAADEVAAANARAAQNADAQRWNGLADAYGRVKAESEAAAAAVASTEAANAAAAAASASAQAAAQQSLDERTTGYYDLATALRDATAAQLAQTEIDQITELRKKGVITLEEEKTAIEAVGLAYGIFTPQSLALASATDELTRLFAAHRISADDLAIATGNLGTAAADGQVDLDELGITIKDKVTPEFANARDKAEEFEGKINDFDGRVVTVTADKQSLIDAAEAAQGYTDKLNGIDGRVVTNAVVTNVVTNYSTNGTPTTSTEGYEHGPGRAAGGDVYAGWPYWVGENGPEPFIPAVNGRIVSAGEARDALAGSAQPAAAGPDLAALMAVMRALPGDIARALRDGLQMA